ncbi:MAG: hypothetical protein OEU50_04265 [Gammaproteobacteria bacterium]|nr:hypothetical protein [Gammaproteobacteria bacterium]
MAGHKFELRADFRYGGNDNRIERIDAEVLTGDGWQSLQIGNDSPGFLIFVYAFLICQHTYFHANSGESGLLLKQAKLELSLHTGEDWLIDQVSVDINAELRAGEADAGSIDYIKQRMRLCPVSINLKEPEDYRINLEFG